MVEERKSFPLRIASRLFDELKQWADDEMRSVNGQIEYLLRQAVLNRRKRKLLEENSEEQSSSQE